MPEASSAAALPLSGPCAGARIDVDSRCAEPNGWPRRRSRTRSACARCRRQLMEVDAQREADATVRDRRQLAAQKDAARKAYRSRLARAQSESAVREAARGVAARGRSVEPPIRGRRSPRRTGARAVRASSSRCCRASSWPRTPRASRQRQPGRHASTRGRPSPNARRTRFAAARPQRGPTNGSAPPAAGPVRLTSSHAWPSRACDRSHWCCGATAKRWHRSLGVSARRPAPSRADFSCCCSSCANRSPPARCPIKS